MGKTCLHRQVKDKNLFAAEAQYYPACWRSFSTEYHNRIGANQRAEKSNLGTKQAHLAAAHIEAFIAVYEYVLEHVSEQNEVLQLSSLLLFYINALERNGISNTDYRSELAQEA